MINLNSQIIDQREVGLMHQKNLSYEHASLNYDSHRYQAYKEIIDTDFETQYKSQINSDTRMVGKNVKFPKGSNKNQKSVLGCRKDSRISSKKSQMAEYQYFQNQRKEF